MTPWPTTTSPRPGDQGKLEEAIAEYREAIRLKPDYADAHHNLGICLAPRASWRRRSPNFVRRSGSSPPDPCPQPTGLALALPATSPPSDYDEALTHARKAVELAPWDVASVNTLALAEYRSGHWAESVAAAERAMQLRDGGSADDWFILALALWQKGEKDYARMWFDKAAGWTI